MKFKNLALAITATVASFSAAAETPYGDLITNTVSLNYSVTGGTTVTATPATAEFNVDRLVKFNLTAANTTADAPVGETTTIGFTLTNNSNAAIDYSLPVLADVTYYIDANGDGVLDAGETTVVPATFTLDQQADANPDDHIYNYIAVYLPQQGVDGQTVAETDADGNFITTQPETVTFTFVGANISLAKAVTVVSDPISRGESGTVPSGYLAKAIPGAVLEYTITVTNSGAKDATLALTDTMPSIFAVTDIDASSYKQSLNGVTATDISGSVTTATDASTNIVTITFPSATATAKVGSDNGTVVTTFEVKLP